MEELRQECIVKLNKFVNDDIKSIEIEDGIYTFSNNYAEEGNNTDILVEIYKHNIDNIISNLDKCNINNTYLIQVIDENMMPLNAIAELSPDKLFCNHFAIFFLSSIVKTSSLIDSNPS